MAVRGGHMECGTSSLISRRTNRLRCATHSILARVTAVAMRHVTFAIRPLVHSGGRICFAAQFLLMIVQRHSSRSVSLNRIVAFDIVD